jgi:hypothetical protein
MEEMHCRFCFKPFARIEKHEAKCEGLTIAELSRAVHQLTERVDAQDRLIADLRKEPREPRKPSDPVTIPTLTEADLKIFLCDGVDAMVQRHTWPVACHNRITYVCDGTWGRATDAQLKNVASSVISQLAQLFPIYVARKGWLTHDPNGMYPEKSLKVYGIQASTIQQALLRKAKS